MAFSVWLTTPSETSLVFESPDLHKIPFYQKIRQSSDVKFSLQQLQAENQIYITSSSERYPEPNNFFIVGDLFDNDLFPKDLSSKESKDDDLSWSSPLTDRFNQTKSGTLHYLWLKPINDHNLTLYYVKVDRTTTSGFMSTRVEIKRTVILCSIRLLSFQQLD